MIRSDELTHLAVVYLKFLITRDESALKGFLSTDFKLRLKVSQQLKLIKSLPTSLQYGITPEVHLWGNYNIDTDSGSTILSPFQFGVSFRNFNNPLISETMTITIHELVLENTDSNPSWKIASILNEVDHTLLIRYASEQAPEKEARV